MVAVPDAGKARRHGDWTGEVRESLVWSAWCKCGLRVPTCPPFGFGSWLAAPSFLDRGSGYEAEELQYSGSGGKGRLRQAKAGLAQSRMSTNSSLRYMICTIHCVWEQVQLPTTI